MEREGKEKIIGDRTPLQALHNSCLLKLVSIASSGRRFSRYPTSVVTYIENLLGDMIL